MISNNNKISDPWPRKSHWDKSIEQSIWRPSAPITVFRYSIILKIARIGNFSESFPLLQFYIAFATRASVMIEIETHFKACVTIDAHCTKIVSYLKAAHAILRSLHNSIQLTQQNHDDHDDDHDHYCLMRRGRHCAYSDIRRPSKAPIFRSSSSSANGCKMLGEKTKGVQKIPLFWKYSFNTNTCGSI